MRQGGQWHRDAAFERWYGANFSRLAAYAVRCAGDGDGAQQALVEALRRCAPHMVSVPEDAWWGYVTTAIRRATLNWIRAERRHTDRSVGITVFDVDPAPALGEVVVQRADLYRCLQELEPVQRRIAELKMRGFVDREISEMLRIGPDVVFRQVKKTRLLLSNCLAESE